MSSYAKLKAALEAFHIRGMTYSLAGARQGDRVPMDVGALANAGSKGKGRPGGVGGAGGVRRAGHKSPDCYRPRGAKGGGKGGGAAGKGGKGKGGKGSKGAEARNRQGQWSSWRTGGKGAAKAARGARAGQAAEQEVDPSGTRDTGDPRLF